MQKGHLRGSQLSCVSARNFHSPCLSVYVWYECMVF